MYHVHRIYLLKKKKFNLQRNLLLLNQICILITNGYINPNDDNFIIEIRV